MSKQALAVVCALLLGACSGGSDREPVAKPTFPIATALLDNGDETTLVTLEVAETPEQRERGLRGRISLRDDWGFAFVFFEEREEGLALEDTSIPLSIAYFDARGEIVGIADVDACDGPCEADAPDRPYLAALAVDRGSFDEWEIDEGDTVHLTR